MARPRTFDESEVLERAVALFLSRGYERASMPELTAHLGICRQSLYNAFGDKRGLYLAALDRYGSREVDAKLSQLTAAPSPLAAVRSFVTSLAACASQCPTDGCLTITAIVDSAGDEEARTIVEGHVDRLEKGLKTALKRAQQEFKLTPDAQPTRLARSLITTYYGIGVLAKLPGSALRIKAAAAEALERLDSITA
jgi:TetR/AcrR family transcriptional repressor of nem operon